METTVAAIVGKAPDYPSKRKRREYTIGIGLLLCVVFLWTASNFVTQVREQLVYIAHCTRLNANVI